MKHIVIIVIATATIVGCQKSQEYSCDQPAQCTRIFTNAYVECPDPKHIGEIKVSFTRDTIVETMSVCDTTEWLVERRKLDSEWWETRKFLPKDVCNCN